MDLTTATETRCSEGLAAQSLMLAARAMDFDSWAMVGYDQHHFEGEVPQV